LDKHHLKTFSKALPPLKRIFVVEDHVEFRECLVEIVNDEEDLSVCGQAGEAEQARKAIAQLQPDLVLVDLTLPGKGGLELIKEVRAESIKIKLLVVSMHDEAFYARRALEAGGDGYIMKNEDPQEIIQAIRDVLGGTIYLSEAMLS
jgi:DNA-binding NarL/FixJ family response regulator